MKASRRPLGTGLAAALLCTATLAAGQTSPVGLWRTVDEKTGAPKAEIRIAERDGALFGRIEKRLTPDAKPDAVCTECSDDRKGQPITGLEIIRGTSKSDGKDVWEGGKILDPENGRIYSLRLTLIDGGRKLEVRGSLGPFGRTQTWQRIQ